MPWLKRHYWSPRGAKKTCYDWFDEKLDDELLEDYVNDEEPFEMRHCQRWNCDTEWLDNLPEEVRIQKVAYYEQTIEGAKKMLARLNPPPAAAVESDGSMTLP